MDDVIIGCFTVFYKIAKPSIKTEPVLHKSVHRPHNKSSFTQQKPCSFSMFLFSVNPFAAVNVSSQKQSGDKSILKIFIYRTDLQGNSTQSLQLHNECVTMCTNSTKLCNLCGVPQSIINYISVHAQICTSYRLWRARMNALSHRLCAKDDC